MKKIYFVGLLAACANAFAQAPKVSSTITDAVSTVQPVKDHVSPSPVRVNPDNRVFPSTYFGKSARITKIGTTQNDQQTNAAIYRRIEVLPEGKMSASWTTSTDQSPYVQRGSGYNHAGSNGWGPVSDIRIEPERAGFPNYAFNPTTNEEIITSHIVKAQGTTNAGAAGGLLMNKSAVGSRTWTTTTILDTTVTIPGILWNRTAISGDYMHVVASYTDSSAQQPTRVVMGGVRTPQVYSRYKFSTDTWEVKNQLLPGYDNTRYYAGGGDNYSIDAVGSNVAVLIGGLTDDLTLWKSTDNGTNWTKTIIDSFPVAAYNYKMLVDTSISNDGGVHLLLDNSGKAHCFWPIARVLDVDTNDESISYFPGQTQLRYWQEGWPIDTFRVVGGGMDEDNDGQYSLGSSWNATGARYGNHSIVTMPYSGITANGHIYMIYSALTEKDEATDGRNYRDVYVSRSVDGGETWQGPVNLTSWIGLNVEQIFASMAKTVNDKLHITFMQKTSIGRYDATNNPGAVGPYDIYYMSVDTADLFASGGVLSTKKAVADVMSVEQNFPNPFSEYTSIAVTFKNTTDAVVRVTDIMGREMLVKEFKNLSAGKSVLDLNLGNIPAGVYMYTISADGVEVTNRMMVK
ncbi:MAG: T9SS type A sorting domain-containing protein [Bacteroidota bacterium]